MLSERPTGENPLMVAPDAPSASSTSQLVTPPGGAPAINVSDTNAEEPAKKEARIVVTSDPVRSSSAVSSDPVVPTASNAGRASSGARRNSADNIKAKANTRKSQARVVLVKSSWYHSNIANYIRAVVNSKAFSALMMVSLFLALFLPDIWVIAGMNSDTTADVLLTTVMFLFTFECVALSATDAKYFLGFFFFMDICGTVSMITDITWMLGTSNGEPTLVNVDTSGGAAQMQFMILRATRAAKVGARAGRLTRVLKILRFLPGVRSATVSESEGIAASVSSKLGTVLANRTALLTIVLVIIYPAFGMWSWPSADYSPSTWCERLSNNMVEGYSLNDTDVELELMAKYFGQLNRGPFPYKACSGKLTENDGVEGWDCSQELTGWSLSEEPPRLASAKWFHTDTFMLGFNMHEQEQLSHCLEMAKMIFTILIMVFSSLALSSVVQELAVRPLERMLGTVREIAQTVFKFSADIATDEADEAADIDNSSEMKLLEKVVQKLAVVADLQTRKNEEITEDMEDEDIAVLNLLQGKMVEDVGAERAAEKARKTMAPGMHGIASVLTKKKPAQANTRLEDLGVVPDVYHSFAFDMLALPAKQRTPIAVYTITYCCREAGGNHMSSPEESVTLQKFVDTVEKEYRANPFHNFQHGVDVTHGVARMMRMTFSEFFLSELEQYMLLIAGIGHDLGHPGVNNGFLSEVGHELALQYNDRSPLENMHCAKLYQIISTSPEANVFQKLTKEEYREARKACIEVILHTDMVTHGAMVKELQMLYQMNAEVFDAMTKEDENPLEVNPAAFDVFNQPEAKLLAMECLLHSADVSNPCRAWDVTRAWAGTMLEEFFAQGDQEKMLGIPVQALNDRDKLNPANSQIVFIEFMIAPFFTTQIRLWPKLYSYGENLLTNINRWEEIWIKDSSPAQEEQEKLHARIARVHTGMTDSINRVPAGMDKHKT